MSTTPNFDEAPSSSHTEQGLGRGPHSGVFESSLSARQPLTTGVRWGKSLVASRGRLGSGGRRKGAQRQSSAHPGCSPSQMVRAQAPPARAGKRVAGQRFRRLSIAPRFLKSFPADQKFSSSPISHPHLLLHQSTGLLGSGVILASWFYPF